MNELIEALTILSKYCDSPTPTHCEHDVLYVMVDPENVSDEDKKRLDELHFVCNYEEEYVCSYYFGSA